MYKIHFIGIGGVGMSGIAKVLNQKGYEVSGSDQNESPTLEELRSVGIKVFVGHQPAFVNGKDVVVRSSAIPMNHVEVLQAKEKKIPILTRAEMLAEVMRGKTSIGVAGTHGKTTTTSMLSVVFEKADLDPTVVVGGKVVNFNSNSKLGKSEYVIAETDESDGSFLTLPILYSIVTNIDSDHLDYYGSIDFLEKSMLQYIQKTPFFGKSILCGDDRGIQRIQSQITKPYVTYGKSKENDYFWIPLSSPSGFPHFEVWRKKDQKKLGEIKLPLLGEHNASNSMAVIALCDELKIPFSQIKEGLESFQGIGRRFEIKFHDEKNRIMIMEDYAHHPTEIDAVMKSVRQFWDGRIRVIFQPHRFSRMKDSWKEFVQVLSEKEELHLLPLYPAGESPIPGVHSEALKEEIAKSNSEKVIYLHYDFMSCVQFLEETKKPGDLFLVLGAGDVYQVSEIFKKILERG